MSVSLLPWNNDTPSATTSTASIWQELPVGSRHGPLPPTIALWLQAATVPLAYLHGNSGCTSTSSRTNIWLTPGGDAHLVEAAACRARRAAPHAGLRRAGATGADRRWPDGDVYSLGAALYALLTGRRRSTPRSRETGLSDLKPAREVNPNIEPYLPSSLASHVVAAGHARICTYGRGRVALSDHLAGTGRCRARVEPEPGGGGRPARCRGGAGWIVGRLSVCRRCWCCCWRPVVSGPDKPRTTPAEAGGHQHSCNRRWRRR